MDWGTEVLSRDDAYAHASVASAPPSRVSCPSYLSLALLLSLSAFSPNGGDLITKLGTRIVLAV
jgi:hypothetical protein